MKAILIIILSIFLQSCASLDDMPVISDTKVINIDKGLLELCPRLKEDLKILSFEDILTVYSDLATTYTICSNKQADGVKVLKQVGGIKDGVD